MANIRISVNRNDACMLDIQATKIQTKISYTELKLLIKLLNWQQETELFLCIFLESTTTSLITKEIERFNPLGNGTMIKIFCPLKFLFNITLNNQGTKTSSQSFWLLELENSVFF